MVMFKKLFLLLFIYNFCIVSYSQLINVELPHTQSQEAVFSSGNLINAYNRPKRYGHRNPDNIIKLELLPLSIVNFRISYERVVNERTSAGVTLGFLPYRSIPFQGLLNAGGPLGTMIEKARIDGFSMSPELRHYLLFEHEVPEGFYLTGYVKYSTLGLYSNYNYVSELGDIVGIVESRLSRYGIGAGIGYQWIIADIISIDCTFLALGVERYITTGTISSNDFTEIDLRDINREIMDDFERDGIGNLETQIGFNHVKIKHKTFLPSARFTISVGYGFK